MALAASSADPATLRALDAAADAAVGRGAPAAAAELLDLAIGLGGDTPVRRIRAADQHMRTGDLEHARSVLNSVMRRVPSGLQRSMALNLLAGMQIHSNSFAQAADLLLEAFDNAEANREVQVRTLLLLSFAQLNAGDFDQALENAERAVSFAGVVGMADLTSQVLSVREVVACMSGYGVSSVNIEQALALENPISDAPIALRASANCDPDERGWFRFQRLYDTPVRCSGPPRTCGGCWPRRRGTRRPTARAGWKSRSTRPGTPGGSAASPT